MKEQKNKAEEKYHPGVNPGGLRTKPDWVFTCKTWAIYDRLMVGLLEDDREKGSKGGIYLDSFMK